MEMSPYRFPASIRELMLAALPEDTAHYGETPELRYTYVPESHARALHPDNMLVQGMRGSGKSFWWSSLQSETHRGLIERLLPKAGIATNTIVSVGFGEKSSPDDYPGKDVLGRLVESIDARQVWRTVVVHKLSKKLNTSLFPSQEMSWIDRVHWVIEHPEQVERFVFNADESYGKSGKTHLIVFDALDRTADDWMTMSRLIRGLLQVLLEFRSNRSIRLKAFLRPDHLGDDVRDFPDSSKILKQTVQLRWPPNELYSLLWQYLANEPDQGEVFRQGCSDGFRLVWDCTEGIRIAPEQIRLDEDAQRRVFHAITGPWMGKDQRRGFPYTWLPSHLADARRQVSPRSFLAALRHAAEDRHRPEYRFPIFYESIKRGVQEASRIRVGEMQEDYPWVEDLMRPLAGLNMPCTFETIATRWNDSDSLNRLRNKIASSMVKLPPAHLDEGEAGVREDLQQLGIFDRLSDGRVNLPDVYRVGYGMGRKGGVKPVRKD